MNSSGIKRGLAITAVSALAVVGLPLTAGANTVNQQVQAAEGDPAVTLYTVENGVASTRNDGVNSTIRLEAGATADIADIRFEYSTDSGATWNLIAVVARNDNGAFSTEWAPGRDAAEAGGALRVRAYGQTQGNPFKYTDSESVTLTSGADAVNVTDGDAIGYFKRVSGERTAIVTGTTSASADPGTVYFLDGDGTRRGTTAIAPLPGTPTSFASIIDLAGYDFDATDEIVIGAENDSDDAESYSLYKQELSVATATPANPIPFPGTSTSVAVKVTDQAGKPVAGVQVIKIVGGIAELGDGVVTDATGTANFTQNALQGNVTYVAKAQNTVKAYQAELGDKKAELALGAARADKLVASSNDGPAFDRDEYATGNITVQVLDQAGKNYDVPNTQDLTYSWKITPFDKTIRPTTTTAVVNGTEIDGGKFNVNLPSGPSGTYELLASLGEGGTGNPVAVSSLATYKVGEGAIVFDDAPKTVADNGTTASIPASLQLEDGTKLPGRNIGLSYSAGTEYDAIGNGFFGGFTGEEDAQLVSNNAVTLDDSGRFTAQVRDRAETPTRTELGGVLYAFGNSSAKYGSWDQDEDSFSQGVDFVTGTAPARSDLSVDLDATGGPAGSVEVAGIRLVDEFGVPLRGVRVQLSLDHGVFVKGIAAKPAAAGDYVPTPDTIGDRTTVITNENGFAVAFVSITRDAGFDDDNLVDAKLTGSVSGNTGSDTIRWNAANPLNVSEIKLVRTPGQTAVDPASTDRGVAYDLYAKDQFGNPVKGVEVSIGCAVVLGDDDDCPTFAFESESDLDNGGDVTLFADDEGTFTFTATTTSTKYDANKAPQSVDVTASVTQAFYRAVPTDFAISAPTTPVPVGSAATVKVTVKDQKGNAVQGLDVEFVRVGDPSQFRSTSSLGEAAYVFNRTTAGSEVITAVVRDGEGSILEQLEVGVTFGGAGIVGAPVAISPAIKATSKGKRDVIRVDAPASAAGAGVSLVKSGKVLARGVLNADGNATLQVKDKNGKKSTTYKVVIDATASTAKATRIVRVK